jgi:hypothetical protein
MIKKRGNKFVVTNKSGTKVLGTHPSKEAAAKQLAAIEISKAKHMQHENKRFKDFRSELNESEYKETLTGYPNRGIDTDVGPVNKDLLPKVNAVLTAMNRYTYQHTSEALIKIRTRLNLFMLDFQWTPWMWQNNTTGAFALPVTLFGRVDGVDGTSGSIRFDGRANPNAGLQEFNLSVTVETAEDGLYRVTAKLAPKTEPVMAEEGVEVDGDALDEMAQTASRQKEMERKIAKQDDRADRAYTTKMNSPSYKKAKAAEKRLDKTEKKVNALLAQDRKEYESPRTYGRGGKLVKRGSRAEVKEGAEQIDELSKATKDAYVAKRGSQLSSMLSGHTRGKQLTGKQQANAVKGIKQATGVKEEAEQIDEAGAAKLARMGYAYDRARVGSRGVNNPERKQQMGDAYYKQREKVEANKAKRVAAGTFDKERELEALHKKYEIRRAKNTVKEELVGGQKRLDVNKNKRLDAQDFKMLRSKKKPVEEALIGGQKRLDVNKNKRLDSQDFAMLRNKKKAVKEETVEEAKMKQWTPRLDRLLSSSRDAVRSKPKKMIAATKIKDGKKMSTKLISAYTPKKAVKEYTEMLGGIPLTAPDPTAAMADKSGKSKRFHKKALKSVEEAVAKGKKVKKSSPHQGAANVIGRNKAIKSRLEKHNMRW